MGSDEERFAVLDASVNHGFTFIDTADLYGDNEELVGKWLKRAPGLREKVFLATKFGVTLNPDGTMGVRGDAAYVKECAERSLKRLGVDVIDLYYAHRY